MAGKPRPSEGGLREQRKARNREEIMEAAREVFFEIGFSDATVRDIVRRSKLSPGTFYNYFKDKEAVFQALFAKAAVDLRAELSTGRSGADDIFEFVREGIRPALTVAFRDKTLAGVLRRDRADVYQIVELPELRVLVDDLVLDVQARIDRGELPPLNVELLVFSMRAVLVEVAYIIFNRDPPDIEGGVEFMTSLFVGGFMLMAQQHYDSQ
ncbi:MAG: TetR/AcrR family transcriptional regulator [Thermoleophilaceae bacterium]|nr:TetR/AcrR family transcriptional regulator [Thermoleophilaceae bacterium]